MTSTTVTFENNHTENVQLSDIGKSKLNASDKAVEQKRSLCLFKRSTGSWFNLKYDSDHLENFYQECSRPYAAYRFKFTCIYSILAAVIWLIYVIIRAENYIYYIIGFVISIFVFAVLFGLAFIERLFNRVHIWLYLLLGTTVGICSLATFFVTVATATESMSMVFNMFVNMQGVLLMYTMVPIRLWKAIILGGSLSVLYLVLVSLHYKATCFRIIVTIILFEIVIHLIGMVHHLILQARRRSTFLKIGQSAELRLKIKDEQNAKKEMIQSLMPLDVAQEVMAGKEAENEEENKERCGGLGEADRKDGAAADDDSDYDFDDEAGFLNAINKEPRQSTQIECGDNYEDDVNDLEKRLSLTDGATQPSQVKFRKFHVNQMKNVSILFADIVGFTKMSSNKTAPHLVYLLNDLFGRFDKLCEINGCEKIATLGDCYYCVAGCPKSTADHAERCVEMGRSMCKAIQQFDERHNEEVNMRVGVHTGTVTCGIVGTHRFKFDVWSHDVTLANEMESSGEAGRVHISEETYEFVKDIYEVRPATELSDFRKLNVLTEYYDEETQTYNIKHVQEQAKVKTFFVHCRIDQKPEHLIPEEEEGPTFNAENKAVVDSSATEQSSTQVTADGDKKKILESDKMLSPSDQAAGDSTSGAPLTVAALSDTGPESTEYKRLNDEDVVRCLKDDPDQITSFFKPDINNYTLQFLNPILESKYQRMGLRPHKVNSDKMLTWAHHRVNPMIDAIVHTVFVALLFVSSVIAFPDGIGTNSVMLNGSTESWYCCKFVFYIIAIILLIIHCLLFIPLVYDYVKLHRIGKCFFKFYQIMFNWHVRNIMAVFILALPMGMVLAHIDPCLIMVTNGLENHYGYWIVVGIMLLFSLAGMTLFSMYSFWTKIFVGFVMSLLSSIVILFYRYSPNIVACQSKNMTASFLQAYIYNQDSYKLKNATEFKSLIWIQSASDYYAIEIVIAIFLALALICFLSREIEIGKRASFSCDHKAVEARKTIIDERRQADWLLENIIPSYVIESVKTTKKYSKHMTRVGVIFATIANFSEFYDEQYEGGREMLRVLNEIFSDFEHLLNQSKYKDIEKIKTIGSCFMAASGLNPAKRAARDHKSPNGHLYALMDFSLELIKTLNEFNQQLFNFDFELKIGYNIGDVTAGVIGTTKLLYDIWGDTVNVASRMYSTGEKGRIQVTESVAQQLSERYEFTYRGDVEVKGKGKMKTYLLENKKS